MIFADAAILFASTGSSRGAQALASPCPALFAYEFGIFPGRLFGTGWSRAGERKDEGVLRYLLFWVEEGYLFLLLLLLMLAWTLLFVAFALS